jgi:hypothetical protein
MGPGDLALRDELQEWRRQWLIEIGADGDDFFGVQLIIADEILNHLIDLAHFHKIDGVSSTCDQASWHYCDQWGSQVFEIIQKHHLQSANNVPSSLAENPTTFAMSLNINQPENKLPPCQKPSMCCACGQAEHIGKFIMISQLCNY